MKLKIFPLFLGILLSSTVSFAQTQTFLFTDIADSDLLESVQDNYTPNFIMSYGMARDTMYGVIDNDNNYVTCVYSGYSLYLDPSLDPTDALYMNGSNDGINAEHTYPQSKGATGNAKSDLHHLFPTNSPVNTARGSEPFQDINDNDTEKWYRNGNAYTNIPASNIRDEFSEDIVGAFEPREEHKGDVARAMFYFYTIYRDKAINSDPNYFESQRETLIRWHHEDPVSQKEYDRTYDIATYQGQPNPFVLDSTLAYRMYCQGLNEAYCDVTSSIRNTKNDFGSLGQNYPNPIAENTLIPYQVKTRSNVRLEIFDALGRKIETLVNQVQSSGQYQVEWNKSNKGSLKGVFYYKLTIQQGGQFFFDMKQMVF